MNVLIVSYYFPPFGGGSTARVHNFAKYFPQNGINPFVLTVNDKYYEELYKDPKLLEELDSNIKIFRSNLPFGNILMRAKSQALSDGSNSDGWSLTNSIKKIISPLS